MVNVFLMKWGDKYSFEYVNNLVKSINHFLSIPHKIYCFTDDPTGVECETILIGDFPYNFNRRVLLFSKGFTEGLCIVIDLDVLVLKDFSTILTERSGITVVNSHWKNQKEYKGIYTDEHGFRTTINGSITLWTANDPSVVEIYDTFMDNPEHYTEKYWGQIDRFTQWEHLEYNLFSDNVAHSYFYDKDIRDDYIFWLFNKGHEKEAKYFQDKQFYD